MKISHQDQQCTNSQHYSQHPSFDANLACKLSINEALVIEYFSFWISLNKKLDVKFKDGRYWTCQTQEGIAAHMPYFNRKQIMRILQKLVKKDIIIKANYNNFYHDRTTWFAFKDESFLKK